MTSTTTAAALTAVALAATAGGLLLFGDGPEPPRASTHGSVRAALSAPDDAVELAPGVARAPAGAPAQPLPQHDSPPAAPDVSTPPARPAQPVPSTPAATGAHPEVAHVVVERAETPEQQVLRLERTVARLERQRRIERRVTQLSRRLGFEADDPTSADLELLIARDPSPFRADTDDADLDDLLGD